MTVPTLSDAKTFFASDIIISSIADARISYWIADIAAKDFVNENDFKKLYFNAFMNMLGHYLLIYETNTVSIYGAVSSESVAAVSRSIANYTGDNPFQYELSLTKYGRIFASLLSRLAVVHGGFVATGGGYV